MTLTERLLDLFELFGLRNAMYLRGDSRVLFLINGVQHLGKLLRKNVQDVGILGKALSSVFARTAAFADSFVNLPIPEALCEKYPHNKCAYCGQSKCTGCLPDNRPSITHAPVSEGQMKWSVRDWCAHMDNIYGEVNRKNGAKFAHARILEEIHEVINAQLIDAQDTELSLQEVRRNMAREFADVFAWIFSMSALLEIDLDKVLDEQYPRLHHRCQMRPCNCGAYYMHPWRESHDTGSKVEG